MAPTLSIPYKPLDPRFMKNWQKLKEEEEISWNVVRVHDTHVKPITIPHTNKEVDHF